MSVKAFKDKHIAGIPVIKGTQPHFVGEICFSTVWPGEGWVECNGENGTVDTRETRLFGTPNDASLGQRINDRLENHRHTITQTGLLLDNNTVGLTNAGALSKVFSSTGTIAHAYSISSQVRIDSVDYNDAFTRSYTYYLKMWMYIGG